MKAKLRGIKKRWGWIPMDGLSYLKARKVFECSSKGPAWMDVEVLHSLQKQYPFITSCKYDPASVAIRGRERAEEILGFVKGKSDVKRFLELELKKRQMDILLKVLMEKKIIFYLN